VKEQSKTMNVLIVNQSEVRQLLPMRECIDVMAGAFTALARGDAILPLRPVLWLPEKVGALGMMPAYLADIGAMGLKVVSVFPGNHGTDYGSHQGAVLLFETEHGQLLAVIDASEITAIRTAAVTGLATRLLARVDAGDVAILGSGVQARTHLEAMLAVREARRIRVWSRNEEHARQFATRESRRHAIEVEFVTRVEDAVAGADIICTTTAAKEPVLQGRWLTPGMHINAIGSSVSFTRELDTAAVVRSRLFVDRRESTVNEAGDFLFPKAEGAIGDDHILGEIGEILLGQVSGRTSPDQITLFKSLGLAIEDLAAAHHIYEKAVEKGLGLSVELGGGRGPVND
jgi:ornithine cyclodeaminase/alanine dehydrogenase-like protein (mu-crystallin family)